MNNILNYVRRDIIGVAWLAMGIFIFVSLWSYSAVDPSFNSYGGDLNAINNYCGYVGSFLSDLLFQLVGVMAWVLVPAFLRMSFVGLRGTHREFHWTDLIWNASFIVLISAAVSLHYPGLSFYGGHILVGGTLGQSISKGLSVLLNFGGATIVLWTALSILFLYYTEKTVVEILSGIFSALRKLLSFRLEHLKGISLKKWMASFSLPKQWFYQFKNRIFSIGSLKLSYEGNGIVEEARFYEIKDEEPEVATNSSNRDHQRFPLDLGSQEKEKEGGLFKLKKNRKHKKLSKKIEKRFENWKLPSLSVLEDPPRDKNKVDTHEMKEKAKLMLNKFEQFSVKGDVVNIKPGPAVTMFEFKPNVDVKISKITDLADDLSLALSSESVRIVAPIPGRNVVGIETSNRNREVVFLKQLLMEDDFWEEEIQLPLAIGCEADGSFKVLDLRKMPHMLIAGSTGSGKSVFVVSLITGLLFRHSPETLRLILIDPKQVDLAAFSEIPHLLCPPLRDAKKSVRALKWAISEMEKRYRSMAKFKARNLETFNERVGQLSEEETQEHEEFNESLEGVGIFNSYYYAHQPYIVIVVEEFGDLMAVDKGNVEAVIVRLSQMARACGIHLVLAMQSPRKDVVTGLIKTNIPGRVSFKVASKMDSRIILDESGAERLLSRGDMLVLAPGVPKAERHHGPWLSDEEVQEVTDFWSAQGEPNFEDGIMKVTDRLNSGVDTGLEEEGDDELQEEEFDERYDEILAYVAGIKAVSASLLQRKFRLGYPRAARLIETFESEGVISPANGSKPRQVLVQQR